MKASFYVSNCEVHEALLESHVPNLYVLTSTKKFKELLIEFGEHFDHIRIDSPPVLAVTDAQIIATLCDGVVLVVSSGSVKS